MKEAVLWRRWVSYHLCHWHLLSEHQLHPNYSTTRVVSYVCAREDSERRSKYFGLVIQVRDQDAVPGSWLCPDSALLFVITWGVHK